MYFTICVFIDLEKAYDEIPREEMWKCLRSAQTSECYVKVIKDMYDGATTTVRCAAGLTKEFEVGGALHQGSALSTFLCAIVMDKLTKDLRKEVPWLMMFADDIVLSRQNHRELKEDLKIWRNALEERGLKGSRNKTEYLKVGEELKLKGDIAKRVKNFNILVQQSVLMEDVRRSKEKDPSRWMS